MIEQMQRANEKGTTVPPLSIELAIILLVFLGGVSLISLLQGPQRVGLQTRLDLVTLAALPIALGIWLRKKWAFYAALILLEALILLSPLIIAFSPYFGIGYNWISMLSYLIVGLSVLPLLIANEQHFGIRRDAQLQLLIRRLPIFNILFVIFGVALIIRTVLPYDTVFKDTVRFASDDAVFHMRLVENALFGEHFPRRLFFDAYTYFPYGTYLHFAPLYDQLIIFATWIIGLGSPTKALMETIGAYYPAVLGSLVVFPVYIIGRELMNKYAGVVAALVVATLPGQFLSRSIIGFTDHHVGEVLFSTLAVMFLVLALKRAKEQFFDDAFLEWVRKASGEWVRSKNLPILCYIGATLLLFQVISWEWWVFFSFILFILAIALFHFWKKPDSYLLYTLLAGMALGFYLLSWVGGVFFVLIFLVFGVLQYVINGLRGEPHEYLSITLTPVFLIPLLMLLPFYGPSYPYYNIQNIAPLGVGVITFALPLLSRYLISKWGFKSGVASEKLVKADAKQQKAGTGEYICPICGKKSKGAGIIEHIKTKHQADDEEKQNLEKLKRFLDENPALKAGTGLKKLDIGSLQEGSPLDALSKYEFLLPVFTMAGVFMLALIFFPTIVWGLFGVLTPGGTTLTIAEVHPMDSGTVWIWFTTPFFVALFAMAILALDLVAKTRPEEFLVLLWSIVMFVTVGGLGIFGIEGIGQNRFAYYYAINAAILSGLFFTKAFDFLTGREGKLAKKGSMGDVRSGKKGGKPKRSEAAFDLPLLIFALAVMILFVTGLVLVGIESLAPLAGIVAIFFIWLRRYAANERRAEGEKVLRKTLAVLFIMVLVFYPFPLNAIAKPFPSTANLPLSAAFAIQTAERGIGAEEEWYEALRWMRNNTPEPGVDYYGFYEEPPLNETTGRRDYAYPPSAYGVMSWWDYGHIITWIAHRIPNANPFQAGIGGPIGSGNPGACVFFIVDNEPEANEVADTLGVRYVISDFMMADIWNSLYNKYAAMTVWAGDSRYNTLSYYYRTIEARLHMFDGASANVDGEQITALAHYRLVHESPTFILPVLIIDENTGYMYWRSFSGDYNTTAAQAEILHGHLFSVSAGLGMEDDLNRGVVPDLFTSGFNATVPLSEERTVMRVREGRWTIQDEVNQNVFLVTEEEGMLNVYQYGVRTGQPNLKAWTPPYLQPVSFVKVFEYVAGASIEGRAPQGSVIEVSTTITTNQGRAFTYAARTTAQDSYTLIVPYSTEGPLVGGTNFDIIVSPYTLRVGHFENETLFWDAEQELRIHEEDVINGRVITVDLL
ncbi:MAG: hypothetical protein EFT35_09535 [Methanophagales archaeon ANME-1-THS]|nr:MAG: hypothetical protein EFT35_09535 [Methanophagales archaeon ANME-1-THS]